MIYDLQKLKVFKNRNLNIGIFGGSFNPPHYGHLNVVLDALNYYKFDYIIWLIANQNPFKKIYNDDIFVRAKAVEKLVHGISSKSIISTAEYDMKTYHTSDSLKILQKFLGNTNLTWIMGIDNVAHFQTWKSYKWIIDNFRIIIFDRPIKSNYTVGGSNFVQKFVNNIMCDINESKHQDNIKKNIIFHKGSLYDVSSTEIRTKYDKK